MGQVGIYPSRSDQSWPKNALTAAGIASVIAADDAGGAYPFDTGGARLLVDETDPEDATAILAAPPTS